MNFRNWCFKTFGINGFAEGKILNCVFIPAVINCHVSINHLIQNNGGSVINRPEQHGLLIPKDSFKEIKEILKDRFAKLNLPSEEETPWLNRYFLKLGVDLSKRTEYKDPSPIHLLFVSVQEKQHFIRRVPQFKYTFSRHPISKKHTLLVDASIIKRLQILYDKDVRHKRNLSLTMMKDQLKRLCNLKQRIIGFSWEQRLDTLSRLAKDFTNPSKGPNFNFQSAVSTYAFSLKLFAEIHRDILSVRDYQSLLYVSSLLASHNENGRTNFSLETDALFLRELRNRYSETVSKSKMVMLKQLPPSIEFIIGHNIINMFNGGECLLFNSHASSYIPRFLPNRDMKSDTDEIMFQSGGSKYHSAILRIIKVGFLTTGIRAKVNETADFYRYYKVEDNLGMGRHLYESNGKICTGTYITQLKPMGFLAGTFRVLDLDPIKQPNAYQKAMEFTLHQLIRTERLLMFYRFPYSKLNTTFSVKGSNEAVEWERLNQLKITLSGEPYSDTLIYYSHDPLKPGLKHERKLKNQKNFVQEGGSCIIFSLKSLVGSILGLQLTTLHTNFMQVNSAASQLRMIDEKIYRLSQSIKRSTEHYAAHYSYYGSRAFFSKTTPILSPSASCAYAKNML